MTVAVKAESARPDPRALGDRVLEACEAPFVLLERALDRVLPPALNPLAHAGAVANVALIIAAVSGVALLFWYSPSVHFAYDSVKSMDAAPYTSGLVRSIHRYSSDLAVLFAVLHGARLFFARRFRGPRWFAWTTGVLSVGTLWLVGWLGYWLVWDERARQIARGTAKWIDPLPIFAEPFSRSFLVDQTVNSLLFFVIFFVHMLVPLVALIFLWLHVTRLARPRFLPSRALMGWTMAAVVLVSLAVPATAAGPAKMLVTPPPFTLDGWYLLPLYLTERLGSGAQWALFAIATVVIFAVPRALARGKAPAAQVNLDACNGCTNCFSDCPYDAIRMVPRSDGRGQFAMQAQVDAEKCVGCGICAGACEPGGIGVPTQDIVEVRKRLDRWVADELRAGGGGQVAFVCASSAGAGLRIDAETGRCDQLPGYRVMAVPCSGAVQTLTVERALKRGSAGVLIVGCAPVEPPYREGAFWTAERLAAHRAPKLRMEKLDPAKVRFLELDRLQRKTFEQEAAAFRTGTTVAEHARRRSLRVPLLISAGAAAAALAWLGTLAPYRAPNAATELIATFRHPGSVGEHCRILTAEELEKLPVHMRQPKVCERGRAPVRMRIELDGAVVLERGYAGGGLRSDGNSVAIEHLPVTPGEHRVRIQLGDTLDPAQWTYQDEREVEFHPNQAVAVLFDRGSGFSWYGAEEEHSQKGGQEGLSERVSGRVSGN